MNNPRNTNPDEIIQRAAEKESISSLSLREEPDLSLDAGEQKLSDRIDSLEEGRLKEMESHLASLGQQLQEQKDNHELRQKFAWSLFGLMVAWLVCVVFALVLSGFSAWSFNLSDQVLIAFITATTVNVVGVLYNRRKMVVSQW